MGADGRVGGGSRAAGSVSGAQSQGGRNRPLGVARPTAGLSEIEFRERAEFETGRSRGREGGAVGQLLRLASVG